MNKLVIDFQTFKNNINKICHDISQSGWTPDYVVGLTRGGLFPAVMISHYFNVPCETLKVCLRDNQSTESNCWMAEDAYAGLKNILIVDDINDTGATLNWIMKDWPSICHPTASSWNATWNNNVRFAVVVDNLSSQCNVKMDYVGFEINKAENDVWIDFPYEEWWAK
jgi:uncharacterized protein